MESGDRMAWKYDWIVEAQAELIADKKLMMEFVLSEYIVPLMAKRDKAEPDERIDINMEITEWRWYMESMADRIQFNRRLIRERRKQLKAGGHFQDSEQLPVEGRDGGGGRTGRKYLERLTLPEQSDRGVSTGGIDSDIRTDKARENTFRADIDG